MFTYAPHYSTLSLALLSRTFSLPIRSVNSIVSKMIWNEELSASLDQAAGVVIFHRIELSRTQQVAQILSDKVSAMVDQNEKLLDQKLGGTTGWGDRGEGGKGDKRGEQTQERRGRSEKNRGVRGTFLCHLIGIFLMVSQAVLAAAGARDLRKVWETKWLAVRGDVKMRLGLGFVNEIV